VKPIDPAAIKAVEWPGLNGRRPATGAPTGPRHALHPTVTATVRMGALQRLADAPTGPIRKQAPIRCVPCGNRLLYNPVLGRWYVYGVGEWCPERRSRRWWLRWRQRPHVPSAPVTQSPWWWLRDMAILTGVALLGFLVSLASALLAR
jgi:hypothetical protein